MSIVSKKTIHVEGLDLAGKSTTCRLLRDNLNCEMRNNFITLENYIFERANELMFEATLGAGTLGGVYYGALLYDLKNYRIPENFVVQDSTIILRSIAYHTVFGDNALASECRKLLDQHPRFGKSVVLWASDEVRLKRLEGRCSRHNDNPDDFLIVKNPDAFHRMQDVLIDVCQKEFNAEIIDTSFLENEGEKDRVTNYILKGFYG